MTIHDDVMKDLKNPHTLKVLEECRKLDEPVKPGKWRNLYFNSYGQKMWGTEIHQSEAAALRAAKQWERETAGKSGVTPSGYYPRAHLFTMQLPVKS